ncbi:hypothetical protein Nepgr_009376 [Nepenthes gracilis]|uniref:Uncharacterized protein n=1 Tax=Nepenthes gracilis TaxID=150966 RepID=A0AAD3SB68_NEPGR|nr:hypothetical protein Nepgr_009376 [Nepenthes gracilis]
MPSHLIDSVPIQTTYAACSVSAGDVSEDDGTLSGSMNDEPANVVTNTDHPVLDVGAPFVANLAAGSPHRPLTSTGVDGVAISDEFGLIPGVDGSTPESIAQIARKYSLIDVVDGLLKKAPSEFQDVRSIPLSGCPVKGSEASVAEAVQPCDLGRGLVHALPNVDPCAGDPLAHAIPAFSDDNGILQCPDLHLPCCSKATCVPVGPSSGNVAAVQGFSPCNPSSMDPTGLANRSILSPVPVTGCSYVNSEPLVIVTMDSGSGVGPAKSFANPVAATDVGGAVKPFYAVVTVLPLVIDTL